LSQSVAGWLAVGASGVVAVDRLAIGAGDQRGLQGLSLSDLLLLLPHLLFALLLLDDGLLLDGGFECAHGRIAAGIDRERDGKAREQENGVTHLAYLLWVALGKAGRCLFETSLQQTRRRDSNLFREGP
jgi:hypothetical protein